MTGGVLGLPLQFSTDRGSETTQLHGLATALWSALFVINISTIEADFPDYRDHTP